MVAVLAMLALQRSPEAMLRQVATRYGALESAKVLIGHESGPKQELVWARASRFELKVLKPDPKTPTPDWYCDGAQVLTRWSDHSDTTPYEFKPQEPRAFEASAGPVMGWLLKSPDMDRWLKPSKGSQVQFSWGSRIEWRDQPAREVLVEVDRKPLLVQLRRDRRRRLARRRRQRRVRDGTGS